MTDDTAWWMQRIEEARALGESQRRLWMCIRQALIILLGGIEDYLGIERSIVPKHRR